MSCATSGASIPIRLSWGMAGVAEERESEGRIVRRLEPAHDTERGHAARRAANAAIAGPAIGSAIDRNGRRVGPVRIMLGREGHVRAASSGAALTACISSTAPGVGREPEMRQHLGPQRRGKLGIVEDQTSAAGMRVDGGLRESGQRMRLIGVVLHRPDFILGKTDP